MVKTILYGFLMAVIGYFYKHYQLRKNIKQTNDMFRIPKNLPVLYDEFKENIENQLGCEIGNIMDVCFRYGYEERDMIEEDKIDKMLVELSGDTITKN